MNYLETLTTKQLRRLYNQAWRRMTQYDGYQPFGYDVETLRITQPIWFPLLQTIAKVHDSKLTD